MDNFNAPPPSTNSDAKTTAIVSYITIIGWLVAYFAMYKDNKTEFAGYHLRQSLLINILPLVFAFLWPLLFFAPFMWTVLLALRIAFIVLWVIGLVYAIQEQKKPIPIIGEWAQSMFKGI